MAKLNTYLMFDGNCEEAFDFYKSIFGGEFTTKMRFKDFDSGQPVQKGEEDKIMHVSLSIGNDILMGSDRPCTVDKAIVGNNFSISIAVESRAEVDKLFSGLSQGGKITMPVGDTFWGAYFGMVIDKFDINWMVSFEAKK